MGDKTGIAWTDATWNPTRGCTKVSEGCRNCYAMKVAARFSGPGQPYEGLARRTPHGPEWTGKVAVVERAMGLPLRWRTPRRIFVDSMSDIFHPEVSDETVARIFAVMAAAPRHTFQVLTKRPERMAALLASRSFMQEASDRALVLVNEEAKASAPLVEAQAFKWPLPNAWLGTSVEDQASADERIPHLLRTPAALRFISAEPLLGPVDLRLHLRGPQDIAEDAADFASGPGTTDDGEGPFDAAWARVLRDQCRAKAVPYFFKQMGGARSGGELESFPAERYASPVGWVIVGGESGLGYRPADLRIQEFPGVLA